MESPMVYITVIAAVVFVIWALIGLSRAHAGVNRLFEHIEEERGLARGNGAVWAGSSTANMRRGIRLS